MIDFYIGPRENEDGSLIETPAGEIIPRPFDIRNQNRSLIARTNGGTLHLSDYAALDLIYETTGNDLAKALRARYNPIRPRVWMRVYDHIQGDARWYDAIMYEPHIERSSGSVIGGMVVPFRRLIPYEVI